MITGIAGGKCTLTMGVNRRFNAVLHRVMCRFLFTNLIYKYEEI